MAAAATGLIVPSNRNAQHSGTSVRKWSLTDYSSGVGNANTPYVSSSSGFPTACKRLLSDRRFIAAVFRHLESPHVMLRAKTYLLTGAILTVSPSEAIPLASDARLPACLERDLNATRSIKLQLTAIVTNSQRGSISHAPATAAAGDAPSMVYLFACASYFSNFVVSFLVPLVFRQVMFCLGCIRDDAPPPAGPVNHAHLMINHAVRKPPRPRSMYGGGSAGGLANNSNNALSNSSANDPSDPRTWLAAFTCLPYFLNACPTIRTQLVLPADSCSESTDRFCLLSSLGQLLSFWASTNPIAATGKQLLLCAIGQIVPPHVFRFAFIRSVFTTPRCLCSRAGQCSPGRDVGVAVVGSHVGHGGGSESTV